jgi:hypothetical protein
MPKSNWKDSTLNYNNIFKKKRINTTMNITCITHHCSWFSICETSFQEQNSISNSTNKKITTKENGKTMLLHFLYLKDLKTLKSHNNLLEVTTKILKNWRHSFSCLDLKRQIMQLQQKKEMHCKPPCYWYKTFCSFPNYNDSRSLTTYCSIVVHAKFFHVANAIIFIIVFSNYAIDFIIGEKTRHHTFIIYCCKWMIMSMVIVHIAPLFSWQKPYMKCKLMILHI